MTIESTKDKLVEMHLSAMKNAFEQQLHNETMKELSFEDRFSMPVDVEYTNRKNNSLKRIIANADFCNPDACIADINYTSGRKLNRDFINRPASCEYIREHHNLFITGATGCGKTYPANAFGIEACKNGYSTKYIRLPDFLITMKAADEKDYPKVLKKFAKPVLLIIDEWLLLKVSEEDQHNVLELLEKRSGRSSTIFCSQYQDSGWYDRLGGADGPLSEAILDRIVHDACRIDITGIDPEHSVSMREVYGLDKNLSR
jgi:DNA replication protein DnaC